MAVQVLGTTVAGGDLAVLRAQVPALAVHDHAGGLHHTLGEPGAVQRLEQVRRAGTVVRDEVGDVVEVDPEADPGGLVADRVEASAGTGEPVGVVEGQRAVLGTGIEVGRGSSVRGRADVVDR